ncbi:MAG: hypothetical protein KGR98_10335 [Verrucomicrobia bacterium]|nr:hypothetical protein [Verrucomicrobiota bacterium]
MLELSCLEQGGQRALAAGTGMRRFGYLLICRGHISVAIEDWNGACHRGHFALRANSRLRGGFCGGATGRHDGDGGADKKRQCWSKHYFHRHFFLFAFFL